MAASIEATSAPHFVELEHRECAHYLCLCDAFGQSALEDFCLAEAALGKAIDVLNVDAIAHFDKAVASCIAALPMDSHVYLCGGEAFITRAFSLVLKLGVTAGAVSLVRIHDSSRNIQCAHCKSIYHNVPGRIFYCASCGVDLVIRDHFSARYGAYQAVMIRREDPDFARLSEEGLR